MNTDTDLQRLRTLIDTYGAQPRRWPAHERTSALALLDASGQARAWLDEARATDALLDAVGEHPAPAALRERLLARAPRMHRGWRASVAALWRDLGGWSLAGPALTSGMVLGLGLGVGFSPLPTGNDFDEDTVFQMAGLDAGANTFENWIEEQ